MVFRSEDRRKLRGNSRFRPRLQQYSVHERRLRVFRGTGGREQFRRLPPFERDPLLRLHALRPERNERIGSDYRVHVVRRGRHTGRGGGRGRKNRNLVQERNARLYHHGNHHSDAVARGSRNFLRLDGHGNGDEFRPIRFRLSRTGRIQRRTLKRSAIKGRNSHKESEPLLPPRSGFS